MLKNVAKMKAWKIYYVNIPECNKEPIWTYRKYNINVKYKPYYTCEIRSV